MMIRDKGKAIYERATHSRKRSGSSSTSYRRSAFVDHQGIEHHPEHYFFRTTTPPHFRRWRSLERIENEIESNEEEDETETETNPYHHHHHHHHLKIFNARLTHQEYYTSRYRQRLNSASSSSNFSLPTHYLNHSSNLPIHLENCVPCLNDQTNDLLIYIKSKEPKIQLSSLNVHDANSKPIKKSIRRSFESFKLEFKIGLLRTRKKVAKIFKKF
ncbi:hypothetical protein CROQUDRAFT_132597 [Cronartium quercuum f. sp. fusiforme G11]|uniref:Uncharacterized protein n=1 Tax=Cronartium quercuum f. sp. fusiforme G11 TaxID=708437 RepID=A0A9P6NHZ8_9BASI|nr:hypothetical protein CROQUDRAFT_132597 [Cronartium quercuum f. sp. fusiforme G11]